MVYHGYSSSIRRRLYIWLSMSTFAALAICILSSYVYFLWIKIAEFAFFPLQKHSVNLSHHGPNSLRLILFLLGAVLSISCLVFGSYYYLYKLYTCRTDSRRTILFLLQDCSFALLTVLASATSFVQLFESIADGGDSEAKLLLALNCQWLANYSVLKTLTAVFSIVSYYTRIRSEKSEFLYCGSALSTLQGVRLQHLSELSAWTSRWPLIATYVQSIALDCLSSSAVASGLYVAICALFPVSQSVAVVLLEDLLRQLAGVLVVATSIFLMSFLLSLLLSFLHAIFHFLVLAHPMDFSLLSPTSGAEESLLLESLTLGLGPAATGAEGPFFSSFVARAKTAISARCPPSSSQPVQSGMRFDEAAALVGEPEWRRAIALMAEFHRVMESESAHCSPAVPLLCGAGGAYPSLCLSLGEQHCRALAFQDLHRLASSASSDKASKARRARLFRGGVPSVVFACCAVIHATALQVNLLKKRLDDVESRASNASKPNLAVSTTSPWLRVWGGFACRLGLVGLLAGFACQLLLRACSNLLSAPSLEASSPIPSQAASSFVIWVASLAAAVSAMVATGLLLWFVAAERRRNTAPPSTQAVGTTSFNGEVAQQRSEDSSTLTQAIAPLLARFLDLDFLARTVPVSALTSQMVCHAAEGMVSLLLAALAEDESGGSHRYAACAMDALLLLRGAIEDFSSALLHSGSFQCLLPAARKSNRFAAPHGVDPDGVQHIRYKLHSSWTPSPTSDTSSLSPQLLGMLGCVQKAIEQLVMGYSDVLQLNYSYSQKTKMGFSSPAVAEAVKQTLYAMGPAAQ